jgi:ribulose-5-phosphate 4-epimerase/fuculose-1-phosphate aldolase
VHLHSTYATAISCLSEIDPEDAIPPLTPLCRHAGRGGEAPSLLSPRRSGHGTGNP